MTSKKKNSKSADDDSTTSQASCPCKFTPAPGPPPTTDILNTEFMYYSAVLKIFSSSLMKESDRMVTNLWMKKLFGASYHSTPLKPKRNKFLLYLTLTLYNDETYGIFKQAPPCSVLPDLEDIPFTGESPPATWELDTQWRDTLNDLPEDFKCNDCNYLHDKCPEYPDSYPSLLDSYFRFHLWIIRPYITLMKDTEDKTKAACWIQTLCGIGSDPNCCPALKMLRNEYLVALMGYVQDLRLEGPFLEMPPEDNIYPIDEAMKRFKEQNPFNNPVGRQTEEFLTQQPLPETGAFAYINLTGSLLGAL